MNIFNRIRKSILVRRKTLEFKYLNARYAWRTNKPILVIESDDWGAEHIKGKEAFDKLHDRIPALNNYPYKRDGLETADDVRMLSELLSRYKDSNGNKAVISANFILANPDYQLIEKNGFKKIALKTIDEGWNHESDHNALRQSYKDAIDCGTICPQLHGLLHFKVEPWLNKLQNHDKPTLWAFEQQMLGFDFDRFRTGIQGMDGIYVGSQNEISRLVSKGVEVFRKVFGRDTITTVPPCYVWRSPETEIAFAENGIKAIQGKGFQYRPDGTAVAHWLGQKGANEIIYMTRNCILEPVVGGTKIANCIKQIDKAFTQGIPAIICSHRVNYTSRVDKDGQKTGLDALENILQYVTRKYSNAIFISSAELVQYIADDEAKHSRN